MINSTDALLLPGAMRHQLVLERILETLMKRTSRPALYSSTSHSFTLNFFSSAPSKNARLKELSDPTPAPILISPDLATVPFLMLITDSPFVASKPHPETSLTS